MMAREDGDDPTIAAAPAAGLLTKYTFLPPLLVALLVTRRWRSSIPGLVIGLVFFVRNVILTVTPVAPFFFSLAPHVAGYRDRSLLAYLFSDSIIYESLCIALLPLC